jgi:hypothetical protein
MKAKYWPYFSVNRCAIRRDPNHPATHHHCTFGGWSGIGGVSGLSAVPRGHSNRVAGSQSACPVTAAVLLGRVSADFTVGRQGRRPECPVMAGMAAHHLDGSVLARVDGSRHRHGRSVSASCGTVHALLASVGDRYARLCGVPNYVKLSPRRRLNRARSLNPDEAVGAGRSHSFPVLRGSVRYPSGREEADRLTSSPTRRPASREPSQQR